MKALAYSILAIGAAVSIWNISATMTRGDFATRVASSCEYSDQIRLPVEAFGAHWRIQNFRKNVLFPNGFDDAFPRAIAASDGPACCNHDCSPHLSTEANNTYRRSP